MLIPEELARVSIDQQLQESGYVMQPSSGWTTVRAHVRKLARAYFRHQSLAYRPDWVDEKFTGRLSLDVKTGEEGDD